jgi:hypothetical protein
MGGTEAVDRDVSAGNGGRSMGPGKQTAGPTASPPLASQEGASPGPGERGPPLGLDDRRWLYALVATVALIALSLAGTSTAAKAAAASRPTRPIVTDEAFVSTRYDNCAAFTPSPHHCTFAVAASWNRSGGYLYGVELVQQTGDDCYRGIVYFFDGTRYLTNTRRLPPGSFGGVKAIHADGTARFSVSYWVDQNENTSCAEGGDGGTDTYVYLWTGTRMVRMSGQLPPPPKVILGTGV